MAKDPSDGVIGGWAGYALERAYLAGLGWQRARAARSLVRAAAPVISIGNLVAGGTGKTPCTLWSARALLDSGARVAIVARPAGGAVPGAEGDEIRLLREGAPFARVIASKVKSGGAVLAARALREAGPGPAAVLVDDGFSHHALRRDLDVVLVDAARPIGNGHLLPRGPLREPPTALARAHVVIATRADRVTPERLAETLAALARLAPAALVAAAELVPTGLTGGSARGSRVVCLSGLARPGELAHSARALGLSVEHDLCYPDHHRFRRGEWRRALRLGEALGGGVVVSAKDAARLTDDQRAHVRVLEVEWRMTQGEAAYRDRLADTARKELA